jgi:hypothetical protein
MFFILVLKNFYDSHIIFLKESHYQFVMLKESGA